MKLSTAQIAPLPDVQSLSDARGIAIQKVGVSEVSVPLSVKTKSGKIQHVDANAKISVSLSSEQKGTHMSRFMMLLAKWSETETIGLDLSSHLAQTLELLEAENAEIELSFNYYVDKTAPVSGFTAPMPIPCTLITNNSKTEIRLTVPVTTLCPCSKEISKYGAHNQRALIDCSMEFTSPPYVEDIVAMLEECASCALFPILKREDEKFVTETQYENPRFAEDVLREAVLRLRKLEEVTKYSVEVKTLESIHAHNAFCFHSETKA